MQALKVTEIIENNTWCYENESTREKRVNDAYAGAQCRRMSVNISIPTVYTRP